MATAVTEAERHQLHIRLDETLGSEEADILMRILPPAEWRWDDVATKSDLTALEDRLETKFDARFDLVDARFDLVDERFARVDERFARVDDRFDSLEHRLDDRFDSLERRLDERFGRVDDRFSRVDESMERRFEDLGHRIEAASHRVTAELRKDMLTHQIAVFGIATTIGGLVFTAVQIF